MGNDVIFQALGRVCETVAAVRASRMRRHREIYTRAFGVRTDVVGTFSARSRRIFLRCAPTARLEAGVTVPRDQQREVVRLLYVATRHQVQALAACLELEGLE